MTIVAMSVALLALFLLVVFLLGRASGSVVKWRLYEALLFWHTLTWIGACVLLVIEPTGSIATFSTIVSISQISCIAGALFAAASASTAPVALIRPMSSLEQTIAVGISLVSALVCLAFVVAVLHNEQLGLMLASVITGDGNFLEYRLTMSTGDAVYLAPGYVKQFRDVLLPASLLALAAFGNPRRPWFVTVLGIIGASAAVLSGERSVILIYVFMFGAIFALKPRRTARARWVVPTIVAVLLFGAFMGATVLLGRADTEGGGLSLLSESATSLFDRLVLTVARENAGGFLVWGPMAPTWGATWLSDLSTILPGTQSGLSNELHDLLGGGPQGTSPLGLPSDAFLAWGFAGVALMPFLYCVGLQRADEALLHSELTLPRALRVIMVPLSFAWYSPFLFILNGGIILVCAALSVRMLRRV